MTSQLVLKAGARSSGAVRSGKAAVRATLKGNAVEVLATARIRAPFAIIWGTLTDYDHMSSFVPDLKRSRVIDRQGSVVIVEQVGDAGGRLFRTPIKVVVESQEQAPSRIGIRLLSGNLRKLTGAYHLERVAGSDDDFELGWNGLIEPGLPLPTLIALPIMQNALERQFLGLVREIERREGLRLSQQPALRLAS